MRVGAEPAPGDAGHGDRRAPSASVAVTQRVRLGTSVLVLPMRHPLPLAKELAKLSLSGDERDPLTSLRLQKLLYYAQAWSLVMGGGGNPKATNAARRP